MATPGRRLLLPSGKRAILASGKGALLNADGECPECGCVPAPDPCADCAVDQPAPIIAGGGGDTARCRIRYTTPSWSFFASGPVSCEWYWRQDGWVSGVYSLTRVHLQYSYASGKFNSRVFSDGAEWGKGAGDGTDDVPVTCVDGVITGVVAGMQSRYSAHGCEDIDVTFGGS